MVQIVECPRDAMQGIASFIPTELKIAYIQQLLSVGFHTLDMGSFVSPKAVPQLADTAAVLASLDLGRSTTKLLVIVANLRGAQAAVQFEQITYLGYPFSISETFQQRNTKRSITDSVELIKQILDLSHQHQKQVVVYLSMGFGNPYGDPWSIELVQRWADTLIQLGVTTIALADTVGSSTPSQIQDVFTTLQPAYPDVAWGVHFHASPAHRAEKIDAAWQAGCRRFDTALQGYGGCPFAEDELVGNIATESFIAYCQEQTIPLDLDLEALGRAFPLADQVFNTQPH